MRSFARLIPMAFLSASRIAANAQASDTAPPLAPKASYAMSHRIVEVDVPLHVTAPDGKPLTDLKQQELEVFDNDKGPAIVTRFLAIKDRSIQTGFLLDTSPSTRRSLPAFRSAITTAAPMFLRTSADDAFLDRFASSNVVAQPMTSRAALISAAANVESHAAEQPVPGTAFFDAVNRACFNQFPPPQNETSTYILIVFSDGEDTASHASLDDTIDMCLRRTVTVFAFAPRAKGNSTGTEALIALTSRTGGQVFHADDSPAELLNDFQQIEATSRNFYQLSYRNDSLKSDGAFHAITVIDSDRDVRIRTRSGYFAQKERP